LTFNIKCDKIEGKLVKEIIGLKALLIKQLNYAIKLILSWGIDEFINS